MCRPGSGRGTLLDEISDIQLGDRTEERVLAIAHLDDGLRSLLQDEDDARW